MHWGCRSPDLVVASRTCKGHQAHGIYGSRCRIPRCQHRGGCPPSHPVPHHHHLHHHHTSATPPPSGTAPPPPHLHYPTSITTWFPKPCLPSTPPANKASAAEGPTCPQNEEEAVFGAAAPQNPVIAVRCNPRSTWHRVGGGAGGGQGPHLLRLDPTSPGCLPIHTHPPTNQADKRTRSSVHWGCRSPDLVVARCACPTWLHVKHQCSAAPGTAVPEHSLDSVGKDYGVSACSQLRGCATGHHARGIYGT